MFGVEVLVWTADNIENPSSLKGFERHIFRRPLGHVAIKLVLPDTAQTRALIEKYCHNEAKAMLIAHQPITVTVPVQRKSPKANQSSHQPQSLPAWEIYFSYWPGQTQNEIFDRMMQNDSIYRDVEFAKPWADQLDIRARKEPKGIVAYWLSSSLSDWLFGPRKQKSLPIQKITHLPNPEKEARLKKIDEVNLATQQLERLKSDCAGHVLPMQQTKLKLQELKGEKKFLESLFVKTILRWFRSSEYQAYLLELQAQRHHLEAEYTMHCAAYNDAYTCYAELQAKVVKMEQKLYRDVIGIGANPSSSVWMPLSCFNVKRMLKSMNLYACNARAFELATNNCSSAAFQVLYSGLDDEFEQEAINQSWLSFWDLMTPWIAIPEHVGELAMKIAKAAMNIRQAQAIEALEKEQASKQEVSTSPILAAPILIQRNQPALNDQVHRRKVTRSNRRPAV